MAHGLRARARSILVAGVAFVALVAVGLGLAVASGSSSSGASSAGSAPATTTSPPTGHATRPTPTSSLTRATPTRATPTRATPVRAARSQPPEPADPRENHAAPAPADSSAGASTPTSAPASAEAAAVASAVAYASARNVRSGIAVLDLRTGRYVGGGDDRGLFGTASVVKVLIAVRLLATGQMHGQTEARAYRMITQSDDDMADALLPLAGGTGVEPWVAAHYGIASLGSPTTSGRWGNTHITAEGLVHLYAAIAQDPAVGPWLMNAMHHATETAADGTDQFFGIPRGVSGSGIKQGWGTLSSDRLDRASVNSTGYVEHDRYAVAILTEGPQPDYPGRLFDVISAQARLLLPVR